MQIVNKETAVKFRQKDIVMIQILSEMKTLFQGMEMLTKKKTWILVNISHKKTTILTLSPPTPHRVKPGRKHIHSCSVEGIRVNPKNLFPSLDILLEVLCQ